MRDSTVVIFNVMFDVFSSPVPKTSPGNVQVMRASSTSLQVSWTSLSLDDAQGFVVNYTVSYQVNIMHFHFYFILFWEAKARLLNVPRYHNYVLYAVQADFRHCSCC